MPEITLNPGDVLLFYTDGFTEGKSRTKEMYSNRRLMRSIVSHAHADLGGFHEGVLADFRDFVKGEPLHDDVTVVSVKFTG